MPQADSSDILSAEGGQTVVWSRLLQAALQAGSRHPRWAGQKTMSVARDRDRVTARPV